MMEREFALLEEAKEINDYIIELELMVNAGKHHIKKHLDVFDTRELRCLNSDKLITKKEYDAAILKLDTKEDELV